MEDVMGSVIHTIAIMMGEIVTSFANAILICGLTTNAMIVAIQQIVIMIFMIVLILVITVVK